MNLAHDPRYDRDFDTLFRAHYDFLWRSARRLGVPEAHLDDVLQDTFLIAYQHLREFEGRAKHSTWLFQILNNVRRNHQRGQLRAARKHRAYAHESEHLEAALVEATRFDAESMLARRLLAEFIEELDERRRAVFVLAELEGMTRREIACALELNVNTVQSRLRMARRAFDERFAGNQEILRLRQALRERPPRAPASDRRRVQALVVTALELPRASLLAPHAYSLLLKLLAGATTLVVSTVLSLELHRRSSPPPKQAAPPGTPARSQRQPLEVSPLADEPIPVSAPPDAGRPEPPRPSPSASLDTEPASSEAPDQSEDWQHFQAARAALVAGKAAEALAQISAVDAQGELGWERAVTEVAALCRLARNEEAQAQAQQWNRGQDPRKITPPCE